MWAAAGEADVRTVVDTPRLSQADIAAILLKTIRAAELVLPSRVVRPSRIRMRGWHTLMQGSSFVVSQSNSTFFPWPEKELGVGTER
jgi:hypothetical protein